LNDACPLLTRVPGAASWAALATVVNGPAGAVAAMTLGSLSTAASDVVVDSIVVERARGAAEVLGCGPRLATAGWDGLLSALPSPAAIHRMHAATPASTAGSPPLLQFPCVRPSARPSVRPSVRSHKQGTTGSLQSLCWASSAVGGIASAYFSGASSSRAGGLPCQTVCGHAASQFEQPAATKQTGSKSVVLWPPTRHLWPLPCLSHSLLAPFSGSLVQDWGVHPVFAVTALFPLFVSFSALLIDEQRATSGPRAAVGHSSSGASGSGGDGSSGSGTSGWPHAGPAPPPQQQHARQPGLPALAARVRTQGLALWGAVKRKDILLPTAFVFLVRHCG
jgi:hypothetical protein